MKFLQCTFVDFKGFCVSSSIPASAPLKSKSYERPLEIVAFFFCLNGAKVATAFF